MNKNVNEQKHEKKDIVEVAKEFLDDEENVTKEYLDKNQNVRLNKDKNREEIRKATNENQLR